MARDPLLDQALGLRIARGQIPLRLCQPVKKPVDRLPIVPIHGSFPCSANGTPAHPALPRRHGP